MRQFLWCSGLLQGSWKAVARVFLNCYHAGCCGSLGNVCWLLGCYEAGVLGGCYVVARVLWVGVW